MTERIDTLSLHTVEGVTVVVPASLHSITTYVLLEQETWFEKELAFVRHWLQPGMTAVDIGANLGVYTLLMASRVGPAGRVFAYEPGSDSRALLARSRNTNSVSQIEIIGAALSNRDGQAWLVFGGSSELHALGNAGPGENVLITTLDREDAERNWPSPDFVKIDAEGEEERILEGGERFFARHSPLVMFEVKTATFNYRLRKCFQERGYRTFRLLDGAPVLVPDDPEAELDNFDLNLFAAKPDRVRALAAQGMLVDNVPQWTPDRQSRRDAVSLLLKQAFAPAFAKLFLEDAVEDSSYADCLAAYAAWRNCELPMGARYAALMYAYHRLGELCRESESTARLSTFARIVWEAGQRTAAIAILQGLFDKIAQGAPPPAEPFWPAAPRFDAVDPGQKSGLWFLAAAAEQLERIGVYSTYFAPSGRLDWIAAQPFASTEMERRRTLQLARAKPPAEVPARLCTEAPDHLNAEIWRKGMVPGTRVRQANRLPEARTR